MPTVVVSDLFKASEASIRERLAGCLPLWEPRFEGDLALKSASAEVEALIWKDHRVDAITIADWKRRWPRLRIVSLAFTGVDEVDTAALSAAGIAAFRVPGYSTESVAELAVGLTFSALRRIPRCDANVRAGVFDTGGVQPGVELNGKTVAILGTGAIGCCSARKFVGLGCKVIGWNRTARTEFTAAGGAYKATPEAAIRDADVLVLHLALTPETKGLIDRARLGLMRPSAVLINVARAGLVDTEALAEALREGRLAGAGIDVYDGPDPMTDVEHPLFELEGVVLTPHVGFKTREALGRLRDDAIDNLRRWQQGGDHPGYRVC